VNENRVGIQKTWKTNANCTLERAEKTVGGNYGTRFEEVNKEHGDGNFNYVTTKKEKILALKAFIPIMVMLDMM
jgi:hypothetical protein